MRTDIPVGSIVLVQEPFSYKKALKSPVHLFNKLISDIHNCKWTSVVLTDIDDDGTLHIIEVTTDGIKKTKYEDWAENQHITIYIPNYSYSKEELYLLLDYAKENTYSKKDSTRVFSYYLFYACCNWLVKKFNLGIDIHLKGKDFFNVMLPAQLVGHVWDKVTNEFNFWHEETPKSIGMRMTYNAEMLYNGRAKEL